MPEPSFLSPGESLEQRFLASFLEHSPGPSVGVVPLGAVRFVCSHQELGAPIRTLSPHRPASRSAADAFLVDEWTDSVLSSPGSFSASSAFGTGSFLYY